MINDVTFNQNHLGKFTILCSYLQTLWSCPECFIYLLFKHFLRKEYLSALRIVVHQEKDHSQVKSLVIIWLTIELKMWWLVTTKGENWTMRVNQLLTRRSNKLGIVTLTLHTVLGKMLSNVNQNKQMKYLMPNSQSLKQLILTGIKL